MTRKGRGLVAFMTNIGSRSKHFTLFKSIFALILLLIFLIYVGKILLSPNRGLDITDESLYLLGTSPEVNWLYPFGWSTSWLFELTGNDLAAFRLSGFVVLELSSLLLAHSIFTFSAKMLVKTRSPRSLEYFSFMLVGFFAPMFYYGGYLRTPSYNWANLVLINLSISLLLLLFIEMRESEAPVGLNPKILIFGTLFSFFSLFFGVSKPSTPVFFFSAALVIVLCLYRPYFKQILILFFLSGLFSLALLFLFGPWPIDFYKTFKYAVQSPTPLQTHTLRGALSDAFGSIGDFYFLGLRALEAAVGGATSLVALVLALGLGIHILRTGTSSKISKVIFWLYTFAVGALMMRQFGWSRLFNRLSPESRWINPDPVQVGLIALLLLPITTPIRRLCFRSSDEPRNEKSEWFLVPNLLFIGVIAFGFGSGHTISRQASLAVGIIFFISHREFVFRARYTPRLHCLLIPLICLAGALITIRESYARPYRTASTNAAVVETDFGKYGGTVFIEASLSDFVKDFREAAYANGFKIGDSAAALTWRWKTFPVLMLEGTPPPTIMLTHDAHLDLLEYNLDRQDTADFLSDAWILISPDDIIPEKQRRGVHLLYDAVSKTSGVHFPSGYQCVVESPILELWAPLNGQSRTSECVSLVESGTKYDFDQGFRD